MIETGSGSPCGLLLPITPRLPAARHQDPSGNIALVILDIELKLTLQPSRPRRGDTAQETEGYKYLTKNNFIFFSEILEHVFHVVNQMRPAFISI